MKKGGKGRQAAGARFSGSKGTQRYTPYDGHGRGRGRGRGAAEQVQRPAAVPHRSQPPPSPETYSSPNPVPRVSAPRNPEVVPVQPPPVSYVPPASTINLPSPQSFDLPFNLQKRKATEHCSRFLHRHVPYDLSGVVAHWVSLPPGAAADRAPCRFVTDSELLHTKREVPLSESQDTATTAFDQYEAGPSCGDGEDTSNDVYAAALMVTGVNSDDTDAHVLRRIACLIQGDGTKSGVGSLGCKIPQKLLGQNYTSDRDLTGDELKSLGSELGKAVKDSWGISVSSWTPLVEFQYKTQGRTVVYVPNGLTGDVAVVWKDKQADTAMTGEDGAQEVYPLVASFGELLDHRSLNHTSRVTAELLMAADAYDEMLTRDFVHRIHEHLLLNKPMLEAARSHADVHRKAVADERARVVANREQRRAHLIAEEKKLRDKWRLEDEGKTDGQKQELAAEREKQLKHFQDIDVEVAGPIVVEEEMRTIGLKEKPDTLMWFQYLDRPNSTAGGKGTISHDRLSTLLLCLGQPELSNYKQVEALLSHSLPVGTDVPYTAVSSEIVRKGRLFTEDMPMRLDDMTVLRQKAQASERAHTVRHKRWLPNTERKSILPETVNTRLPLLTLSKREQGRDPVFLHPLPEPEPEPTLEDNVKKQLEQLVAKYTPSKATPLYKVIFMKSCSDAYASAMEVIVSDYAAAQGQHSGALKFIWIRHLKLFRDLAEHFNSAAELHKSEIEALRNELQAMRFNYLSAVAEIEGGVKQQGDDEIMRRVNSHKKEEDHHRELTQLKKMISNLEYEQESTKRERNAEGQALRGKVSEVAALRGQIKQLTESLHAARLVIGESRMMLSRCVLNPNAPAVLSKTFENIEQQPLPQPASPPLTTGVSTQTGSAVPEPAPVMVLTAPDLDGPPASTKKRTPNKRRSAAIVKSQIELKRLHQSLAKDSASSPASTSSPAPSSPRKKAKKQLLDTQNMFDIAPPTVEGSAPFPVLLLEEKCAWPGAPLKSGGVCDQTKFVSTQDIATRFEYIILTATRSATKRKKTDSKADALPAKPLPSVDPGETISLTPPELFRYFLNHQYTAKVLCREVEWVSLVLDSVIHAKFDLPQLGAVEVVYKYFAERFPEKELCHAWLCDFLGSLKSHATSVPRAAMFCHFLGIEDVVFTNDAFEVYVAVMRAVVDEVFPVRLTLEQLKGAAEAVVSSVLPQRIVDELVASMQGVAHPEAAADVYVDLALYSFVSKWDQCVSQSLAASLVGLIPEIPDPLPRDRGSHFFSRFLPDEDTEGAVQRVYQDAESVPRVTLADAILATAAQFPNLRGVRILFDTLKVKL